MPKPKFVSPEEGYKFIQDRLSTGEWWVIPLATESAWSMVRDMEQRFFQGDDGVLLDFVFVACPAPHVPPVLFAIASKSCCSADDLGTIAHVADKGTSDVVIHGSTPFSVVAWVNSTFNL